MIVYRCCLACSVACIIVGISFNNYIITLLNSSFDKLVFAVVLIKGSFANTDNTNKISVQIILISIDIPNKACQSKKRCDIIKTWKMN